MIDNDLPYLIISEHYLGKLTDSITNVGQHNTDKKYNNIRSTSSCSNHNLCLKCTTCFDSVHPGWTYLSDTIVLAELPRHCSQQGLSLGNLTTTMVAVWSQVIVIQAVCISYRLLCSPTSVIGDSHFSKVILKIIRYGHCGGLLSITLISLIRRMCVPMLMNVGQRSLKLC